MLDSLCFFFPKAPMKPGLYLCALGKKKRKGKCSVCSTGASPHHFHLCSNAERSLCFQKVFVNWIPVVGGKETGIENAPWCPWDTAQGEPSWVLAALHCSPHPHSDAHYKESWHLGEQHCDHGWASHSCWKAVLKGSAHLLGTMGSTQKMARSHEHPIC